jgi:Potential Queuosine, Q, salvage protein family
MSCVHYSPELSQDLAEHRMLPSGSPKEVEIRAGSIVAVEDIRTQVAKRWRKEGGDGDPPNSVLLDFILWDTAKEKEARGELRAWAHHHTRTVYY